MPSAAAACVHLRHEGGDAAGVPAGQQVGVVVRRVDEQPSEQLLLRDLLAQRPPGRWSRPRPCRCRSRATSACVTVTSGPVSLHRERVVVQDDVGGHELGEAGHRDRLLGGRRLLDADGGDGDGALRPSSATGSGTVLGGTSTERRQHRGHRRRRGGALEADAGERARLRATGRPATASGTTTRRRRCRRRDSAARRRAWRRTGGGSSGGRLAQRRRSSRTAPP